MPDSESYAYKLVIPNKEVTRTGLSDQTASLVMVFSDILIRPEDPDEGIVIEVKYAKEIKGLDVACEAAMTQIKDKRYYEALRDEGRCNILAYGIAFSRKRCKVNGEKL